MKMQVVPIVIVGVLIASSAGAQCLDPSKPDFVKANTEGRWIDVIQRCPAEFTTVWLTLVGCKSPALPNGLIIASPSDAGIWHHQPPHRVMWAVNGPIPPGQRWTIEWKDKGDPTQSKDIFPSAAKVIATPGRNSFMTGLPSGTTNAERTYQYTIKVKNAAGECATLDPQIVLKDNPPPPPPPPPDDPDRD